MFSVKINDRNTTLNEGTLRRLKIIRNYFTPEVAQARQRAATPQQELPDPVESVKPIILSMMEKYQFAALHKPRAESPAMDIAVPKAKDASTDNLQLDPGHKKSRVRPYKMRTEDLCLFKVEDSLVEFTMPLIRLPLARTNGRFVSFNDMRLVTVRYPSTDSPAINPLKIEDAVTNNNLTTASDQVDDIDQELTEIEALTHFNLSL